MSTSRDESEAWVVHEGRLTPLSAMPSRDDATLVGPNGCLIGCALPDTRQCRPRVRSGDLMGNARCETCGQSARLSDSINFYLVALHRAAFPKDAP